jgi:UPF0716 protein FxsA
MRLFIGLILLAFPFLELFLLIDLAHRYGWWVLFYLVVIGFLGLQLIKGEKLLLSAKMMQSLSNGSNPIKTLLGSARNMVAGVLLIIPGVITDIIAAILLLVPINKANLSNANISGATNYQQPFETRQHKQGRQQTHAANDDVIEGEFTEIDDDKK